MDEPAVLVAYGDAQTRPVDGAGVPTGDDAVVGQMAIENLVREFLNPINPLSPPHCFPMTGSVSAYADPFLPRLQYSC